MPPRTRQKKISNPLRLLVLTPSTQSAHTIPPFIRSLTGTAIEAPTSQSSEPNTSSGNDATRNDESKIPTDVTRTDIKADKDIDPKNTTETKGSISQLSSFAGHTTHPPLLLSTPYYEAQVPIWIDEIPDSSAAPAAADSNEDIQTSREEWQSGFCAPEAKEVRSAIGGVIIVVDGPALGSSSEMARGNITSARLEKSIQEATDVVAAAVAEKQGTSSVALSKEEEDYLPSGSRRIAGGDEVKEMIIEHIRTIGEIREQIEEDREGSDIVGIVAVMRDAPASSSTASKIKKTASASPSDFDDFSGSDDGIGLGDGLGSWEEDLEDEILGMGLLGWEVIGWNPLDDASKDEKASGKRNAYGGKLRTSQAKQPKLITSSCLELLSIPRILEVLSANSWADTSAMLDSSFRGLDLDSASDPSAAAPPIDLSSLDFDNLDLDALPIPAALKALLSDDGEGGGLLDSLLAGGGNDDDGFEEGNEAVEVERFEALMTKLQGMREGNIERKMRKEEKEKRSQES